MSWALLGFLLAVRMVEGRGDLEHCHLVALDPAMSSAVLATSAEELKVVHAGEDVPAECGPFKVAEVRPGRLVLDPTPAAKGSGIRQAWLSLAATNAVAAPLLLRTSPEKPVEVPLLMAPPMGADEARRGRRQIRVEEPPP